jgi:hypothetical protein
LAVVDGAMMNEQSVSVYCVREGYKNKSVRTFLQFQIMRRLAIGSSNLGKLNLRDGFFVRITCTYSTHTRTLA